MYETCSNIAENGAIIGDMEIPAELFDFKANLVVIAKEDIKLIDLGK